jgi:hypothetical protein
MERNNQSWRLADAREPLAVATMGYTHMARRAAAFEREKVSMLFGSNTSLARP